MWTLANPRFPVLIVVSAGPASLRSSLALTGATHPILVPCQTRRRPPSPRPPPPYPNRRRVISSVKFERCGTGGH